MRESFAFLLVLIGGFALAMAQRHVKMPDTPSHRSGSMVQLAGGNITIGINASEIARFQKLFSVSRRELFEVAVPRHQIRLLAFSIDKRLVTNSEFQEFTRRNPAWQPGKVPADLDNGNYLRHWTATSFPLSKSDDPVVNVNWYAAMAYCRAQGKRLPTEAEWEDAARGGLPAPLFPWGDAPANPRLANYSASKLHTTSPVASFPANAYGIYDMAGNVWEFTSDEWARYSAGTNTNSNSSQHDPTDFKRVRSRRVIRGGSFDGDPINLWVEYRDSHPPTGSQPFIGFRCAK
jgi:formylglycine-generating enzyme required for sulfatase activity